MKTTKTSTAFFATIVAFALSSFSFAFDGVYGDSTRRSKKVVDLEDFKVTSRLESILIEWTTSFEKNNDYYSVEKSMDGVEFKEVGVHMAINHGSKLLYYTIEDWEPTVGTGFYRLLYTVPDGTTKVLETVEVLHEGVKVERAPTEIPDLVKPGTKIKVTNFNTLSGTNQVNFMNSDGELVHTYYLAEEEMNVDFYLDIPTSLTQGVYELQFVDEGDLISYSKPLTVD